MTTVGICEVETDNGKFLSGDSFEIAGGTIEMIGDGPGDEGFRSDERIGECSGLTTSCIVLGYIAAKNGEVKGVNEDMKEEVMDLDSSRLNESESQVTYSESKSPLQPLDDSKFQEMIEKVEDSGVTHGLIENMEIKEMVIDSLDSTGVLIDSVGCQEYCENQKPEDTVIEEKLDLKESRMEDGEPQLSDFVGEDTKSEEQGKNDSEFMVKDTESVEVEVKFLDLNVEENVEIFNDDKVSQIVLMENVQDTSSADDDDGDQAEQPLEIIDDNKESQTGDMMNVEDTLIPDDDAAQSVNEAEQPLNTEAINDPVTNESTISQLPTDQFPDVRNEKQTEFEVVPILIFPDTLVSPGMKIQFGSFGLHEKYTYRLPGDLNAMVEVSNKETEPTTGTNSSNSEIILDDLQEIRSAQKVIVEEVKDINDVVSMSSVEDSNEFIDSQIEDTDSRMNEAEDMIEHEILCLKDEKQFFGENKPFKSYLDQLDSNVGSHDEVQQTVNQESKIEEPLENIRKGLNLLEDDGLKTEVAALAIRKIHEDEKENGKEVQAQLQATNETKSISVASKVEQGEKVVSSVKKKHSDNQNTWKVAGKTRYIMKTEEPIRFIVRESKYVCLNEITEDQEKEKPVVEFDKKAENLGKKESECKFKEQIGSEEKRKKQNAKRAQKRAELLAQKEAEQKEKVREKRLRKKERKKTRGDSNMKDENIGKLSEENEIEKTNQKPQGPPSVASAKRIRRCYQCGKMGMAAALITVTFFLSNIIYAR